MKNALKNPFMGRQKNTRGVLCSILIISLLAFGCEKINNFNENSEFSSIAFIARITDNSSDWSLCVMDKSGNGFRKIVDKTTTCNKPIRSHSGTQLLFTTYTYTEPYTELYSVNIDGTGLTLIDRVEHGEGYLGSPDWSPDDRQIIYVKYSYDTRKSDFIIYNTVNKEHIILNIEGGEDDKHNPKFSPDGKQIAYCAVVKSDTLFMHSYRNHHIYKMDVYGHNNHLIIREGAYPIWSPRGDKIAYLTTGLNGSSQISVANADGSNQKQLTSSVSPYWYDTGFPREGNEDPKWTLDGERIVYVSWENARPEIFIMNVDGSNKTRLSDAEHSDRYPEITIDGNYILFNSNNGIYTMRLNGSDRKLISNIGTYPIACK